MTHDDNADREAVLSAFAAHVSAGKVDFYRQFDLDLVMGERGGCYFHDVDGRRFLNAHCNGGVFNMGHRNPRLVQALRDALDHADIGNHHLISGPRARLAARLAALLPGDIDQVVYGVSGGEAIDLALKMARGLTGRREIVSASGGYHGHTGLAMAAGDARYREVFMADNLPGFSQVPFGDLDALAAAVGPDTAAVILEAVPATLGIVVPPEGYMEAVAALCEEAGALFILDEVQTGLGRTGTLFAAERWGVVPDFIVLGKGMSGGLTPLSATCFRRPHARIFEQDPFVHISTFGGNELACAVALELLEVIAAPAFLERVQASAARLAEGLGRLVEAHAPLDGVRQIGMMVGLVWQTEGQGLLVSKLLFDEGVFAVYSNNDRRVTQYLLPLIAEDDDVDLALEAVDAAAARLVEPQMQAMAQAIAQMM